MEPFQSRVIAEIGSVDGAVQAAADESQRLSVAAQITSEAIDRRVYGQAFYSKWGELGPEALLSALPAAESTRVGQSALVTTGVATYAFLRGRPQGRGDSVRVSASPTRQTLAEFGPSTARTAQLTLDLDDDVADLAHQLQADLDQPCVLVIATAEFDSPSPITVVFGQGRICENGILDWSWHETITGSAAATPGLTAVTDTAAPEVGFAAGTMPAAGLQVRKSTEQQ